MLLTTIRNIHVCGARFVYAPLLSPHQYPFYSALGLYPKAVLTFKGLRLDALAEFIPKRLRDAYGLVLDKEIDAILDASGFAYSDQWGVEPIKRMAADVRRWKKMGKKVIFLPQAFGPFSSSRIRDLMNFIIEHSDLIYARDDQSFNALKLINNSSVIRQSPDFTVLFVGETPHYYHPSIHQVCIVPNQRVIDKSMEATSYSQLLTKAITYVKDAGLSPYFLILGGKEDELLAQRINARLPTPIPLINEPNPKYIKGLIKSSLGLIGSRYHGIASALYSGTVAIGIGWSHKYDRLFSEMSFSEGLINNIWSDEEILMDRLQMIIDRDRREEKAQHLLAIAQIHQQQARQMFAEVSACLNEA